MDMQNYTTPFANTGDTEEFSIDTDPQGKVSLEKNQSEFRAERDALIREADIEIFKLEDNSMDSTAWRTYRQALRDSTLTWTLPTKL